MKVYVANLTKQTFHLHYRLTEDASIRNVVIPIGAQTRIPKDLNTPDIDFLRKQWEPYRFLDTTELDRAKTYTGICYSVDKPVPAARMIIGQAHNQEVLTDRGREMRAQVGLATSDAIKQSIKDSGTDATVGKVEATMVEEEPKGGYSPDHEPIGEKVVVDEDQQPGKTDNTGGKRQRPKRDR